MSRNRILSHLLIASIALSFGFLLADQVRTQLVPVSNRVARNQALVRTVQDLEHSNDSLRRRVGVLRSEISDLEAAQAKRSDATRALNTEVAGLRAHAGLTPLHGPGVTVSLGNGRPVPGSEARTGYLVNFEDVQDVVNLLYAGGAEGVAVNGHRISLLTSYHGSAGTVLIDQGPPLRAPFTIAAVGNRGLMEQLLGDPSTLGDLKNRQQGFQLQLGWSGSPGVVLPAYDSSLELEFARPA